MKKFLTILSLVLALSLCAGASAEETAPAAPTEAETVTEQTATEQTIDAYRALKGSARVKNLDALKAELDAYIVDEKLTQDQADLILKYYSEQFASRGEKGGKKQDGTEQQTGRQKKQRNGEQQVPMTDEQQNGRQNDRQYDRRNKSPNKTPMRRMKTASRTEKAGLKRKMMGVKQPRTLTPPAGQQRRVNKEYKRRRCHGGVSFCAEGLSVRFPQPVQIAVFVSCNHGVPIGKGEGSNGLVPRLQVFSLSSFLRLQENPFDVMSVQHGMIHGADRNGHDPAVLCDDWHMLLASAIRGIRNERFHFSAAALSTHA